MEKLTEAFSKTPGTPPSVNDIYHHSGPSFRRVFARKSPCSTPKTPKYISYLLSDNSLGARTKKVAYFRS